MSSANGYVLLVPQERRETLKAYAEMEDAVGEPVGRFGHPRRVPLIVFVSFEPGFITHIADGRKGVAAGSDLVRLNLSAIQRLEFPVSIDELQKAIKGPTRRHAVRVMEQGGLFPPATFQDFLAAFRALTGEVDARLDRFGRGLADQVAALSDNQRFALAQQKESVGLAMKIAGFDTRGIAEWGFEGSHAPDSFLQGLRVGRVREDAMVVHDLDHVPGLKLSDSYQVGARVFESDSVRLTVILANKLPLEQQLGTDLIYYNETLKAFIMVQYKAMELEGDGKPAYRLPNKQLAEEIARMEAVQVQLNKVPADSSVDGFRLSQNPFYLKLCRRHTFNPHDGGLFPGMYLPLDYWSKLVADDRIKGPRGGLAVRYDNVGRKFTEEEFVGLVSSAWIGTTPEQSAHLEILIRRILESGKAVLFAIEARLANPDADSHPNEDGVIEGLEGLIE